MRAVGKCHLGFGELLQGIYDRNPFLFNFPVSSYTYALVTLIKMSSDIHILAGKKDMDITKSISAAKAFCNSHGIKGIYKLTIHRQAPSGLGLSSSSADIIATLNALLVLMRTLSK